MGAHITQIVILVILHSADILLNPPFS